MYQLSTVLLRHLEPALDMLAATIRACPEGTWQRQGSIGPAEHTYHALSSVDFWIRDLARPFQPPPFHSESAAMMSGPAGHTLDKQTLLDYLERLRAQCRDYLSAPDPELLAEQEVRGTPGLPGRQVSHADPPCPAPRRHTPPHDPRGGHGRPPLARARRKAPIAVGSLSAIAPPGRQASRVTLSLRRPAQPRRALPS